MTMNLINILGNGIVNARYLYKSGITNANVLPEPVCA